MKLGRCWQVHVPAVKLRSDREISTQKHAANDVKQDQIGSIMTQIARNVKATGAQDRSNMRPPLWPLKGLRFVDVEPSDACHKIDASGQDGKVHPMFNV